MAIFEGAGVALITPMNADGSINYDKLEELVEFHVANQTDAIIVCGTTGEAATMTHEEHLATIKACVEMTKKRIPVIAGTGSNCTETSIYLSKEAEKYGADGVLLVSPYYNKATQEGLRQHFTKTAEAIKIPCILYNVPSRTGCNIKPATVKALVEDVPNIVAIKEASGDISQVADVMNLTDGKIDLYSGNDDQIVPILSLGGKGVISVLSNVAPKDTHAICQNYFDGNVKESARLQLQYLDLIHALFCEVNPIPVKKAMNLMGYEAGPLRLPLTEMSEGAAEVLKAELKKCGLIE
ncbi:MAG: 4-hydroxy-tetrahydrodipicolinate synthase [Clostridiales bacterium]|nr:4-hydroxy-tetrahydrodipicolinate synthase [Clostridiales bacterium]